MVRVPRRTRQLIGVPPLRPYPRRRPLRPHYGPHPIVKKRLLFATMASIALFAGEARAQIDFFGGLAGPGTVVLDPTAVGQLLEQVGVSQEQLTQLVTTYQEIVRSLWDGHQNLEQRKRGRRRQPMGAWSSRWGYSQPASLRRRSFTGLDRWPQRPEHSALRCAVSRSSDGGR